MCKCIYVNNIGYMYIYIYTLYIYTCKQTNTHTHKHSSYMLGCIVEKNDIESSKEFDGRDKSIFSCRSFLTKPSPKK